MTINIRYTFRCTLLLSSHIMKGIPIENARNYIKENPELEKENF